MTDLLQMRNNLIQNFYVISVPIEEIIDISSLKTKEKSFDIFVDKSSNYIPKIITANFQIIQHRGISPSLFVRLKLLFAFPIKNINFNYNK